MRAVHAGPLFALFQSPLMLWALPAVSVPIIIHLFFRSRYRVVPWGAMKFLLTSIEQTSRRLKFQELLLLITRCLLIALVILALARPALDVAGSADPGGRVDAVFLIDTSYSMGARRGAGDRLDFIKDRALAVLDRLPAGSTVQVLTCSNRTEGDKSVLELPKDQHEARALLRGIKLTSLGSDLGPGVQEAVAALARGKAKNKKLFVFSDMHRPAWEKQSSSIAQAMKDIKDQTGIVLVHCPPQKVRNVAITEINPLVLVPRVNQPSAFAVRLKNTGSEPLEKLTIALFVEVPPEEAAAKKEAEMTAVEKEIAKQARKRTVVLQSCIQKFLAGQEWTPAESNDAETFGLVKTHFLEHLSPGEEKSVILNGMLKEGRHVVTACIKTDDLPGDNRFDLVVNAPKDVQVLIVEGDAGKDASFHLREAISPVRKGKEKEFHLAHKVVPPRLASPADLERSALCILVNCPLAKKGEREELPQAFLDALGPFVRRGKGLIIYAGDKVIPEDYNRTLGAKYGLLPFPIRELVDRKLEPVNLSRDSATLPAYQRFKNDPLFGVLDAVTVWKYLALEEPGEKEAKKGEKDVPGKEKEAGGKDKGDKKPAGEVVPARVVMRYNNDAAAVAVRRLGAGQVFFITTSADEGAKPGSGDPDWNLFTRPPLGRVYVPFVQVTLAHLLQTQAEAFNLKAGQRWALAVGKESKGVFSLLPPEGKEFSLTEAGGKGENRVIAWDDFPRAGVYRLKATVEGAGRPSNVTPLAVVPDLDESDRLQSLGPAQLDGMLGFAPTHWLGDGSQTTDLVLKGSDLSWVRWLVLAALTLAFFEVGLAYWCSRGR